ncbi:MAG: hypothetical protein ACRDL3_10310 [Solirubrobacterales bacterium]
MFERLGAPAHSSAVALVWRGTIANDGVKILLGARNEVVLITHPPTRLAPGTPCARVSQHKIRCFPGSVSVFSGNTGPGNDRLKAARRFPIPIGMGGYFGRDRLKGGGAGDLLLGQQGADRLKGGRGRDGVAGGPGRDRLNGGAGKDVVKGGPGNDRKRG